MCYATCEIFIARLRIKIRENNSLQNQSPINLTLVCFCSFHLETDPSVSLRNGRRHDKWSINAVFPENVKLSHTDTGYTCLN